MIRSRLRRLIPDAALALDAARRGLTEDPLHFLVQVARRFASVPPPAKDRISVTWAYWWYLADRPAEAERVLTEIGAARGYRGRLARRLSVQLGMGLATDEEPARLRARSLYQVGAYSKAVEAAPPGSRQRDRIASELSVMRPAPAPSTPTSGNPTSVLMVLTNSLPYTQSGYSIRSQALLSELQKLGVRVAAATRLGYPVTIGHLGKPVVAKVDGVPYYRLPAWKLPVRLDDRLNQQVDALERVVEIEQPGVLHCTTDFTNAVVTRELSYRTGLPWVYEMRGQLELSWIARLPRSLQQLGSDSERVRLLRAKEVELATEASAVIALSQVQADDLVARGVAEDKISIIPNGIDAALLGERRTAAEMRDRLGLDADGVWVGAVSSLVDYEGFDILLEAVAKVRASGQDLRCCIVGAGVSLPGLTAIAHELGIEEFVRFPGKQPRSAAKRWVQALDMVVIPRRDTQVTRVVTPLKVVEAMALGRPVLASDLPALDEFVSVSAAGVLVPPGDSGSLALALAGLSTDVPERVRLSENGRNFAAARTWESAARTCSAIYETVCHG